jgi:N-acetylmuramoyl-L-alanine amidase
MKTDIDSKGRLRRGGKLVEQIPSPHTSGAFPKPPRILVVHFTYGASARSSAEWFRHTNNKDRSSAHVVIDRDGATFQCVDFGTVAHHAGKSSWRGIQGLNRHSIGLELANWGNLVEHGGRWTSHTGVPIAEPVFARHKNGHPANWPQGPIGWEPYPEAQFEVAVDIARALLATCGIDEIIGHDDVSVGRKWDPGPAFDMRRFRALVFGDRSVDQGNTRKVMPDSGLNLRRGPGTGHEVIALLPKGTVLEPIEVEGNWLLVNVLDAQGRPDRTGWVHDRFLD